MKNERLPKKISALLAEQKIKDEDILVTSRTDMNTECEYADGCVVLTASRLFVFLSAHDSNQVNAFKGYQTKNPAPDEIEREWAMKVYEFDHIEELKSEPQVACSILIAKVDGTELRLSAYSNLYRQSMHKLTRSFDKLKNPNPDFEGGEHEKKDEDDEYCPICGMMYPDKSRKICPKCMDRKSIFVRVLRYFKPYIGKVIVLFACFAAVAGLNLVWPYLNGTILYDKVLAQDKTLLDFLARIGIKNVDFAVALLMIVLTMLATKIVMLLIQTLQGVFTAQIVTSIVRDLKKDIFANMGKLSISFFKSRQTGSLMTRCLSDAERVTGFFIDGMPYIFVNGFTVVATIVMMMTIKWQMAVVAIIMVPLSIVIGYKMRPHIWSMYGHRHRSERSVNSQVNDNLTGARVVKAFGQEKREITRFKRNNERLRDAEMSIVRFQNVFRITYGSVYQVINIVVWVMGVYYIINLKNMELGVLMTFVGYVGQLQGPVNFFSRIFHWWADSMNSAQRIFEILDAVPEVQEKEEPVRFPKGTKGHIELKNVTFGYEINKPVLKDVTLDIPAGSVLGIVGRSGAGKTTLVNLISRMYDVNEGEILFDSVNVKDIGFSDLRRNVAMVSQETYIFMGTVAENIAYAKPDATFEEIIRAAKLASAHEFIMRMPDGYDTKIGSAGRELSGGERQRISIARAILANPKVLILDEATASVDTETERAIQKSISYLEEGRTTISIAHRLSTLKDADFLVVIDNGRITEQGTADELEALHGTYYKLMELQTKALAMRAVE